MKEVRFPNLKAGDIVLLTGKRNYHWSSSGSMDKFLNTIQTVAEIEISTMEDERIVRFEGELVNKWAFSDKDIVEVYPRYVDENDVEFFAGSVFKYESTVNGHDTFIVINVGSKPVIHYYNSPYTKYEYDAESMLLNSEGVCIVDHQDVEDWLKGKAVTLNYKIEKELGL